MEAVLCFTELAGLFLSLIGYLCCLVALFIPHWLTFSSGLIITENYRLGLWQTCVVQDVGFSVCQEYQTPLHLPIQVRMGRVLVCLSVLIGALGFMASIPALTCVKCLHNRERLIRRMMNIFGGLLFLVAGALTFFSVSYFAYGTLIKFWNHNIPKDIPRWEFGDAMYTGWVGGFFLLSGGCVLIFSQFRVSQEAELKWP
ncbi:putative claudin-24 [Hyla sarda]|uniref:putative claudin-24 n=1 Tax=Hyla sarda TaxID=327740 RepID=UPI0024C262E2|nr:putative claudin-24 [Hyla sarda]